MNQTLILLLLIPPIIGLVYGFFVRSDPDKWPALIVVSIVAMLTTLGGFHYAKSDATSDVEILNGEVLNKTREHDHYTVPYSCNCVTTTDSKGNSDTVCQTCYEDHYTVDWDAHTSAGRVSMYREDSLSRSVYDLPDPPLYRKVCLGDPVALRHNYTNYIQAVPNSLFTPSATALKEKFVALIPAYPDNVYNFFNIDRVLTPGYVLTDTPILNREIALGLRKLGPAKQVNVVLVIAKTDDPNYEYALRDAWENANKNDVVVVIGSKAYPTIDFVRIISWTKNELFKVELRDSLMDLGVVSNKVVDVTLTQIAKNFERRQMREFEYLDAEIDPPTWVIIGLLVMQVLCFVGIFVYFARYSTNLRSFRRFSR